MTELLARIFIRDYESTDSPAVRSAYGKMAGWVGIACNLLLSAGKLAAGALTSSVSITADAVNNLSDASSSVISLFGFKLAEKSADEEHPYGHARYEYLAGFLVAVIILVIGAELLRSSAMKALSPEEAEFGLIPAVILLVSILVKLWMMVFNREIGRRIDSEALKATAADSRNDVISTAAVFVAAVFSRYTDLNLDGIMGIIVALFILYSGIGLIREAMSLLLGQAPEAELVRRVYRRILSYDGVLGAHDLMIHDYGPGRKFSSVHVEVDAGMRLTDCHDVIDRIERDFLADGMSMIIHPDPIVRDDSEVGRIGARLAEIVRGIDERISVHDVRIVPGTEKKTVIFDCVIPHASGLEQPALKREITRFLNLDFPDYACVITFESGYAAPFSG